MDQPVASIRYEIRIDAQDDDGNASSFLHWARSGRPDKVEPEALTEWERVIAAMNGADVGIYADHFQTATLLKGDPPEISSTPTQQVVISHTRGT